MGPGCDLKHISVDKENQSVNNMEHCSIADGSGGMAIHSYGPDN